MKPTHLPCMMASAILVLTAAACAQSSEPPCSAGARTASSPAAGNLANFPFIASAKNSFEQHLPDGGTIRTYIVTHQARDSAGRTMNETGFRCTIDEKGVPLPDLMVNVYDPVTPASLNWRVSPDSDYIVHVFHPQAVRPPPTPRNVPPTLKHVPPRPVAQHNSSSNFKLEDLGTRNIAGVEAQGSRTTITIPVGEEGNDVPLVIMNETWRSKELGITLLTIRDDPRFGRDTYEVQELTRTEPDPSVFSPPEGYKIEEQKPLAETPPQS